MIAIGLFTLLFAWHFQLVPYNVPNLYIIVSGILAVLCVLFSIKINKTPFTTQQRSRLERWLKYAIDSLDEVERIKDRYFLGLTE